MGYFALGYILGLGFAVLVIFLFHWVRYRIEFGDWRFWDR